MLRTRTAIPRLFVMIAACAGSVVLADPGNPSDISRLEALLANPETGLDIAALHGDLGDRYMARGDAKRALEHYDHVVNAYPNDAGGRYRRGEALQLAGHMREAIEAFKRAGTLGYTASDALARMGFCYMVLWRRNDSR